MTSKTWRCYIVSIRSENRRRKHNIVTMLEFGRSNDVWRTTLWQRRFNLFRCPDQKTTKNQCCHNVVCQLGNRDFAHDVDICPDKKFTKKSEPVNQAQTKINITKSLKTYLNDLRNYLLTTYQGFKVLLMILKMLGKY